MPEIKTSTQKSQETEIDPLSLLVMSEWEKGKQYYTDMNSLYDNIYALLRGERPEKNYDWQSNIVINKAFQIIWTTVPYITQKIFGATPIIGLKSFDAEGAWQREQILEYWHTMNAPVDKHHTSFYVIIVMILLRSLLNGVGIMKKFWHQKLQTKTMTVPVNIPIGENKAGEVETEFQEQKITTTIPIEDWPYNEIINNKNIVFDWMLKPGQSIRDGRFIIHREIQDLDYLRSSPIGYKNLDLFSREESSKIPEDLQENMSRDGLSESPPSDIYTEIEVYERQGLIPVYKEKQNGEWIYCESKEDFQNGQAEMKEMVTTIARCGDIIHPINFVENPYGLKNYIDVHIYLDPERWQAMGMVEPVKDTLTAVNDNINAMFDEINQNLMPPVIVNKYALWDWDTMVYAPGQRWLTGGKPQDSILFKEPSVITRDAWTKHSLLDNEIQLTSAITPPMQGMGREKAATTNVLNAQMSAGRLDHIVKMVEQMGLIPSAQMDVIFAKKHAHPLTFQKILGRPFQYTEDEEIYKYIPGASGVKLEYQKETEIQQDIQLIQILSSIQNPKMPQLVNRFLKNILRNRNDPDAADLLDEKFYEPSSDAGNLQMMQNMLGRSPSNEKGIPMSGQEKGIRERTFE